MEVDFIFGKYAAAKDSAIAARVQARDVHTLPYIIAGGVITSGNREKVREQRPKACRSSDIPNS